MKDLFDCLLYAITPPRIEDENSFLQKISDSMAAGIDILQLRLKEGTDHQKLAVGQKLKILCKQKKILFIINDRVDLCQILDADGVHLGQEDIPLWEARKLLGPEKIIGISTHSVPQALAAEKEGADYLGFGPCFFTKTKKISLSSCVKIEEIEQLQKKLNIPFFLIGGITLKKLAPFLSIGVNRVAISAGIYQSSQITETTKTIHQTLHLAVK